MGVASPEQMSTTKELNKERINGGRTLPDDQMMRNSWVWRRASEIYAGQCMFPGPGCSNIPELTLFS